MKQCPLIYLVLAIAISYGLPCAFASDPHASAVTDNETSSKNLDTSSNDDNNWEYSQSIKYSRGKYGTAEVSETYEEDAILQRNFENADLSITIPSLWQTGNVTATENGREIIKKKVVRTSSSSIITPTVTGLGDIALNGDYYLLEEDKNAPLDVTLTGYVKAPTASAKNGLGTGAWDGGPGIGFTKIIISSIKAIADASYTFDGKVSGQKTFNQTSLDAGLEYDITPKITATVKYEWSNPTTQGVSVSKDIALSLDYRINDDWKINGETAFGLSTGAADQTYLLGATVSFAGGILGVLPSLTTGGSSDPLGYQTVSSPFDPISTRIISDPLFLPLKANIYGVTNYSFTRSSSKLYNYKGNLISSSKADGNDFSQVVEYGISDRLSMRLSDSYEFLKTTGSSSITGDTITGNSRGPTNFTIGTVYRVFDQTKSPVDVDLTLNITPNAFASKDAGNHQEGTVASGAQPLSWTTAIGREMKAFTIQGSFTTTYMGNRYYESLSNDENHLDHEYFDYTFAVNTQTRLTDRFSINVGAQYTVDDNMYDTNLSTGSKAYVIPANTFQPNAAINYHFIPNRLVGSLTYAYNGYSNSKNNYIAPTSNTETKNHGENIFGARMEYLF